MSGVIEMDGPWVMEVVIRDCGYGFSGIALMSDGASRYATTTLHPSPEQAAAEVASLARAGADA